jgi:hypothetical protein
LSFCSWPSPQKLLASFENAFPEAHGIQDKLAQVREQVLYGEVDITEAESILLAIKQTQSMNSEHTL